MPGFGAAVGELLVAAIDREDLLVVERGQLRRVVDERRLVQSDLVTRAVAIGELQEAQLVLVGSVYRLEGRILVTARIVDLQGQLHERRSGTVIVRTIEELEGAVEVLAHRLGLRGTPPMRGGERLLAPVAAPAPAGNAVEAIAAAVPRGNPFGLQAKLLPQRAVVPFGELIEIEVSVARPAFLTLLVTDSSGLAKVILPNERTARVALEPGVPTSIPGRLGFRLRAFPPEGLTRIKAVATPRPVDFPAYPADGSMPAALQAQLDGGEFSAMEIEFAVAAPREALPEPPDAPPAAADGPRDEGPVPLDGGEPQAATPAAWHLAEGPASLGWRDAHARLAPPLIAVVDAGFDLRDPRLAHAWARDERGEVLTVDLRTGGDPWSRSLPAAAGHGHAVASLIAARPTPGEPLPQGVLPSATLLPIIAASSEAGPAWRTPRGDAATILEGLRAAADLGARVVNVSLGVPVSPEELRRLAADPVWGRLEEIGAVVVCAAGNDGRDLDRDPLFPAAIPHALVVAVMAVDADGAPLGWQGEARATGIRTATGGRTIDLAAPGADLPAAGPRTRVEIVEGTSFAAALVSAAAAAWIAEEPQLGSAEIADRLVASSLPLPLVAGRLRGGAVRLP